jgi:hypothetical protein
MHVTEFEDVNYFIFQSANNGNHLLDYDGYIDLGKELAMLHILLTENLEKANQVSNRFMCLPSEKS